MDATEDTSPGRPRGSLRDILALAASALLAIAGIGVLLLAVDGLLIEPARLVSKEVSIPLRGLRSGPVRVLLFSDLDLRNRGRREELIRREAAAFGPDLVMVAGDLLDRAETVADAGSIAAAGDLLASLPAPFGRFIVPGEEESQAAQPLKSAWLAAKAGELLVNEDRTILVRGERMSVFGADPFSAPAPWIAGQHEGRTFVYARPAGRPQVLVYTSGPTPGAFPEWGPVLVTFAFQAAEPESSVDFRLAWREADGPFSGDGFVIFANPYHPEMSITSHLRVPHRLLGRTTSGFRPPVGVWCRARVELTDEGGRARVRARFWPDGSPEPGDWTLDAIDDLPGRVRRGTVAFAARYGMPRYGELAVRAPDGTLLAEERFDDRDLPTARWGGGSPLADWAAREVRRGGARVVLAHNPDIVLDLADMGVWRPDLILAGHTHGGQVRLPGFGGLASSTRIGRRYDAGLFRFRGLPLYITAGAAGSGLPRPLNPPEVVRLTLVPDGGTP